MSGPFLRDKVPIDGVLPGNQEIEGSRLQSQKRHDIQSNTAYWAVRLRDGVASVSRYRLSTPVTAAKNGLTRTEDVPADV